MKNPNKARSEEKLRRMYAIADKLPDGKERLSKMLDIGLSICWHSETWEKASEDAERLMKLGYRLF